MKNSLQFKVATFLFKHVPVLYKPLYYFFKNRQDADELNLLKQFIKPGSTVVDIGANIGFYAEYFSNWVGETGKVHCFEPDETNFSLLKKNTQNSENTIINKLAVSDKTGSITLYKSHRLNVDHRTYKPTQFDSTTELKCVSIDDYINNKFKVDFIKMDIQGAEYPALEGMKKTLKNNDIKLLSEFWPYGLKQAGSSKQQVYAFLTEQGFSVYKIDKTNLILIESKSELEVFSDDEEDYYNILATRSSI
ncbi:MAG: FkbM family methyltransferase [Bacteroidia bacterium]|nr:FkbM family methyltransferase [Bacteroidia bacterium]